MSITACALALVLVIDVSRSVDLDEFALQQQGTARALQSERVVHAITQNEGVALSVVFFDDTARVVIPWQVLRTPADVIGFSTTLTNIQHPGGLYTNVYEGIALGLTLLDNPPCEPDRKLIDISGDGIDNQARGGHTPASLVRRAIESDVRINTLPILTAVDNPMETAEVANEHLFNWYNDNFALPTGGFSVRSNGFADFARAITVKLSTEITMR